MSNKAVTQMTDPEFTVDGAFLLLTTRDGELPPRGPLVAQRN